MLAWAVMAILAVVPAYADDAVTLSLEIKDHRFDPAELHAPPRETHHPPGQECRLHGFRNRKQRDAL
jgi:hypothetical protein